MADWQPIETAPRDGTKIIGAYFTGERERRGDIAAVWWQPEFEAFISSCRMMTMAKGYTINGKQSELHSPEIESVSHWIPLPEPPQA